MCPQRLARECSVSGCSTLTRDKYCSAHKTEGEKEKKRWISQKDSDEQKERHRLYGRSWQKRRIAWLAAHPWCEDCLVQERYTLATDVHHVIRHEGNKHIFDTSPLMSLCHSCHSKRTLDELREGG